MRLVIPTLFLVGLFCAACGDDSAGTASGTATSPSTESSSSATTGGSAETSSTGATAGTTSAGTTSAGPTSAGTTSAGTTSGGTTSGGTSGGTTTGGAELTWNNFGQSFFETYCWECHGPGDAEGRDFSTLEGVTAEASVIACGVSPTKIDGCADFPPPAQFPIGNGPKPSEQERLDLVAWIEAGLPEG